ncbi:MAG: MFS transporter, partial [Pseudomonadota bacterium]
MSSDPSAERQISGAPKPLSENDILLLTLASAVVTANAYYIHPIIARVADDFGVSHALIGIVPAANQIALAVGIFLLLPLGDRVSNRVLTSIFVAAQFVSISLMAFAEQFELFVLGSTVLGFFTIAPYLLPAYASKRVPVEQLGKVTAMLTTGVIGGILVARAGAGVIGEYYGWRTVYYIASGLMLAISILLPLSMDKGERPNTESSKQSYVQLLGSIVALVRDYPQILLYGAMQGLGFGTFLAVWMGIGLHLTSPEMGYGVDTVGYLALIALVNLFMTPRLGAWADRIGAHRARIIVAGVNFLGVAALPFVGHSLWLLIIPITIMNIAGPLVDVTSRMTFLKEAPDIRTRLMTVYIVMMFVGGGVASWSGTATYDWAGWIGNSLLAV